MTAQTNQLRVLFVEDEPLAVVALERALRRTCRDWDMSFVPSAEKALALLDRQGFDVIITDLNLGGMLGTDLLRVVKERNPSIIRVVLSGMLDPESLVGTAKFAEVRLCKPTSADDIRKAVLDAMKRKPAP